jgi:hypothetical protein
MSFNCDICSFLGNKKNDLDRHYKTKKHFNNTLQYEKYDNIEHVNESDIKKDQVYQCEYCNKEIKHKSSFSRHKKKCFQKITNEQKLLLELNSVKNELSMLKKDNEIEKLKFKVKVKDLKIKTLEHPTNQTINITNNIDNSNNKNATTNVKISKLEMLNNNFCQVIDMKTFTENFATPKYGLSEKDAENLLEICNNNNSSVDAIINSVLYYVNNSMKKQYENEYNIILPKDKIVLPFISSDLSLRYHFEKNDKEWCKTTSKSNINKIVTLTEKQVFDHKKESIGLNSYKKRRIVNGVLKESLLDNIDDTNNFYKSKDDKNTDNNVNHDNEIKN